MINSLLESEIRIALDKAENRNTDGTVNWDFVDSDCYMSGVNKFFKDDEQYYKAFDFLCMNLSIEFGLSDLKAMHKNQLEMDLG